MQGRLPCNDCPYGECCNRCPEAIFLKEESEGKNFEKRGFYSKEIRKVKDKDGTIKYVYSHPE